MTTWTKISFFNLWLILTAVGNLCQFFGAILSISYSDIMVTIIERIVGFGTFFAWINMMQYLRHNNDLFLFSNTILSTWSILLKYIVGILPIYFAYVFLGICFFWQSGWFSDTYYSMMTLFAMLNGDTLIEIITDCTPFGTFAAMLYFYSFLVLFVCVILNIFIAIIENGYSKVAHQEESSDEENDPSQPTSR